MPALRYAYLVALALWVGGGITAGALAAPVAFSVLPPREAAAFVGELLRRFHLLTYGAGAVLIGALVGMALLGPRPRHFGLRLAIASLMVGLTLVSGLYVNRRVAAMRDAIGVPVSSLPPGDPRRTAFGRLHGLSTLLMGLSVAGGLVLAGWEARDAR